VAERLAAVGPFYREHPNSLFPVIETIMKGAGKYSAVDAFAGQYRLRALQRAIEPIWSTLDVLLLPTTGTIYTIDEVNAEPLRLNKNLGYYTNFVNLLDLCALAVPAGFMPSGLPGGVTFMAPTGQDAILSQIGQAFERTGQPS
jgi:allophanate hydrolase